MYKVVNQKRKKWWKWRNWCQSEVYEETKGTDSKCAQIPNVHRTINLRSTTVIVIHARLFSRLNNFITVRRYASAVLYML